MLLNVTCNFRNRMVENCEWSVCSDHPWTASIYGRLDRVKMNSDTTSSVRVLNDWRVHNTAQNRKASKPEAKRKKNIHSHHRDKNDSA